MSSRSRSTEPAGQLLTRKAVVYARVSSKEQDKEGFSFPAQLKLLYVYAASEGIGVLEEYVDVETAKQVGRSRFIVMRQRTGRT